MKKIFFHSVLLILFLGCSKNDDQNQQVIAQPQIPESSIVDLNGDGVHDFEIVYVEGIWDGADASGGVYSAGFRPIGENKILQEYEENVSTTLLFSQIGDSIQREPEGSKSWYDYGGYFASLWQGGDGVWLKEWKIESKKESGPYYAGIQLSANSTFLIGWLKLEIDKKTGNIDIVDHELTSQDFIVIDR